MATSTTPGSRDLTRFRVWRCARGLLVQSGAEVAAGIDELLANAGRSVPGAPPFVLVDARGEVVATYPVTAWSRDGERGAAFPIVEAGCLLEVTVRERSGGVPTVSAAPVLGGLEPLSADAGVQTRMAAILRGGAAASASAPR